MHGKEEGGGGVKREGTKPPPRVCGCGKKIIGQNKKQKNKSTPSSFSLFLPLSTSSASPCTASSGRSKRRCGRRPGRR